MFIFSEQDIYLSQQANNKEDAIAQVAQSFIEANCVQPAYLQAMLARDKLISTYLANGVAIPHGTAESRVHIKQTAVKIFQFPQGIDWGNGEMAYIVVGIAANSNEHLSFLQQLTAIVIDEQQAKQLWHLQDVQAFYQLICGSI